MTRHRLDRHEVPARRDGGGVADLAWRLRETYTALRAYRGTPVGEGLTPLRTALAALDPDLPAASASLQVDLRSGGPVTLPAGVADEAARALGALWWLSPDQGPRQAALSAFRRLFTDRYGTDALVPLNDLLDHERGIGTPDWELPDTRDDEARGGAGRTAMLAELAFPQGRYVREVVLTEDTVRALGGPSDFPLPPSAEVRCEVLAPSVAALAAGDFSLVVRSGSQQAGSHFGRFAAALPELVEPLREVIARCGRGGAGQPAQLVHRAAAGIHYSVASTPRFTDRLVSIGEFRGGEGDRVMRAGDLLVGVNGTGFRVVSARTGEELDLLTFHLLNVRAAGSAQARFLREVGADKGRTWARWRWGALDDAPHLPRVRYGRAVLSPERWRPSTAMREAAGDWAAWSAAFERWRHDFAVPRRVQGGVRSDHRLALDLDLPLHRRLLHDELRRHPDSLIEEDLAGTEEATGWCGGYHSDLVIPLSRAEPSDADETPRTSETSKVSEASEASEVSEVGRAGGPAPGAAVPGRAGHPPLLPVAEELVHQAAGDWLYVTVDSSLSLHNEILTDRLPSLVAEVGTCVDRWFFLRYTDPRPHLRLRLHGAGPELRAAALPRLSHWLEELRRDGLAGDWALRPYRPEVRRYGGAAALADAERCFHADSEAALEQLRLARGGRLPVTGRVLTALNFVDIARAARPGDWAAWLEDTVPRAEHREVFRAHRGELREVAELDWGEAVERCTAPALAAAWQRRAAALGRYAAVLEAGSGAPAGGTGSGPALRSVLHMHHNRAVGINREAEGVVHALARGLAELTSAAVRYRR